MPAVNESLSGGAHATVEAVFCAGTRRGLAPFVRVLGGFDLPEDALQEAFAAAMEIWPRDGVPANPRAWLVSTGRFKAIDTLRRRARFDASVAHLAAQLEDSAAAPENTSDVDDDRLRLIFTCCHPAL